ncbi:hypothetical protein DRO35_04975 [Candidatus Bathyarchaeota archaeon]|nr:MAG: hypothetical protein DRO35_04975 [Candidatus Bathyarchaeota archaeon]
MIEKKMMGWHVIFAGFRNVKVSDPKVLLDRIRETSTAHIQIFDADMIAGFDHIYFSVLNALRAFNSGKRISENLAVEILLYASGQHQIRKAIEMLGVKPSSTRILVVVLSKIRDNALQAMLRFSEIVEGDKSDDVVKITDEKFEALKEAFEISDAELDAALRKSRREALTSVLIERTALLVTQA